MPAPTKKNLQKPKPPGGGGGGMGMNPASKKPFKPNSKPKDLPSDAVRAALQVEDDVPDFPRGGGSSLSRREREEIRSEVEAEVGLEERGLKDGKKRNAKGKNLQGKSKSRAGAGADDLGSLFGDGVTGKLPRFANKITSKNISLGMKLWGMVVEVNDKDLVVSLPGGLRGLVRSVDAFDHVFNGEVEGNILPSLFHVGQLVSCVVSHLDDDKKDNNKRKIWLTLRLSILYKGFSLESIQEGMVLGAYVKSIEDHGFILHFGLSSFTGFLPKNSQAEDVGNDFKSGQLLQGVVKRIDKSRKVVYLSSDQDAISKSVMKDNKGISIDLLVPGMMVNARVQSTLENGVMLTFLTYFTGTVDMFHLQKTLPTSNWKEDYVKNKKVNARILFIDPSTRAVGLTLNQYLVHNTAPSSHVSIGDIYESSKVVRIDKGFGLLLEIPSAPTSTPAYVGMSDIADDEIKKLEKTFKEGRQIRLRVLGFRQLEGLATGSLKTSALEGPIFTHSDVKPGIVVKAKVIAVDSFGAIVRFSGGLKALCPLQHMSEFEIAKPRKKFQVGAELVFRILGCKSKRVTVTHKKTLVKSKLPIISSYTDANSGLITHGWITKIESHGCFVHFYNGVQGFTPRSELGLDPGTDLSSMYHVGQVVKCRVVNSLPALHRINLSFIMKPLRVSEEHAVKLGSIVAAIVEKITESAVIVCVKSRSHLKGSIMTEHLADHHGQAVMMKSVLRPGYEFDQLLVLDVENNGLILSAKYSLINSVDELPADISNVHPQKTLHGYICNIIDNGCFVRFLGRLTGFSPRSKAVDDQTVQLADAFYVGQSVRSYVNEVKSELSRVTLTLKQSLCASTDSSFMKDFFVLEEKIVKMQSSHTSEHDSEWAKDFDVGSIVEGKVLELKEFGVVVNFDKYNDVFGFISHYQLSGPSATIGSTIRAAVLDVSRTERLVDLSLKPEFLEKPPGDKADRRTIKKRKSELRRELELHQTVTAIVEIVKENYLVLAIPEHNHAIGYASAVDYNCQKLPLKLFLNGQSVIATVMDLPTPSTVGRLILSLKSISDASETSSLKKSRKKSSYNIGSLIQAEITEIKPLEMRVKFGIGFRGRIHITEVNDANVLEDPFGRFKVGETIPARIVAKATQNDIRRNQLWELSIKPSLLSGVSSLGSSDIGDESISKEVEFSYGQPVTGYVYKVDTEWAWLVVSRYMNAQLFALDTSCEPNELGDFQRRFHVGKAVDGHVLSINKEKKLLRVVSRPLSGLSSERIDGNHVSEEDADRASLPDVATAHIHEGDTIGGRVSKILPGIGGLLVQIGPHVHGRVHFTELQESWAPEPLSGYHEGQFVKCKVLEVSRSVTGTVHIDLSLRLREVSGNPDVDSKRLMKIQDIRPNMAVQGYVKNITSRGCFICLSRKLDAKILLSNLSDGFVDNPEKDFPIGKLVTGRVLSVEPLSQRVEVTLKELSSSGASKSKINDFNRLHVGEKISGIIKQVERYGLFIAIDHTNLVGLCHVSQLSDDYVGSVETQYRSGEKVTAQILKVDEERQRISLGMKNMDADNDGPELSLEEEDSEETDNDTEMVDSVYRNDLNDTSLLERDSSDTEMVGPQLGNDDIPILAHIESRASILPIEVTDDVVDSLSDVAIVQTQGDNSITDAENEKDKRRAKKAAREEREREIRAAEERLLENDVPKSVDEYEKVIRISPNSSFLWIKYMAFMLELADIERARSIAERALKTINVREENEKLNVWVAYFNLENEYGNPHEEAVAKVFERALQYCDPKKVHLALLGVYERTEQHKLADKLLEKMVKKFKNSCKIWLKRFQSNLRQDQDGVQPVVNNALRQLPSHKRIKFITQAALLEFKSGVPERGRSRFESILREYPKRTDLWSIYFDQEIKLGDVDVTRALFERAITLSLSPQKMKFFFKRYLAFEKSHGDEERIEYVKKKAMEYAENRLG